MVLVKHFLACGDIAEKDIGEQLTDFMLNEEIDEKDIIDIKYAFVSTATAAFKASALLIYRKNLF